MGRSCRCSLDRLARQHEGRLLLDLIQAAFQQEGSQTRKTRAVCSWSDRTVRCEARTINFSAPCNTTLVVTSIPRLASRVAGGDEQKPQAGMCRAVPTHCLLGGSSVLSPSCIDSGTASRLGRCSCSSAYIISVPAAMNAMTG